MRKWMARLSFSFFILALVFVWEGRRADQQNLSSRRNAYAAAAVACFALGLVGVRERHRDDDDGTT